MYLEDQVAAKKVVQALVPLVVQVVVQAVVQVVVQAVVQVAAAVKKESQAVVQITLKVQVAQVKNRFQEPLKVKIVNNLHLQLAINNPHPKKHLDQAANQIKRL